MSRTSSAGARSARRATAVLVLLLAALLALTPTAPPGSATTVATPTGTTGGAPAEQWRSYWVDAFHEGIYSPAQVDDLVAEAQQVNANVLVVQVGRRFDCFCNDALYPRTDAAIAPEPYDPLRTLVERAHAAGLQVHAWVNATTLWNSATPPRSPDHAFNRHGPSATGADRWLNKRRDGTELVGSNAFLDPANPAAVDYVVAGVRSIVREYDVDGVNLDYIRYPDYNSAAGQNDWGYSDVSLARFRAATGRTDVPAPGDAQFSDWRRAQVSALVRKVYLGMWQVDPQDRLSVDGVTYGYGPQTTGGWERTRPYAEVLQDWKGWLEEGIVDTTVAMNYKRQWRADQAQMFAEWTEVLADWQAGRQSVNGTALYLNDVDSTVAQVRQILRPTAAGASAAGWSGYSYASPTQAGTGAGPDVADAERDRLEAALTSGTDAPFAAPATVPSMPWKEAPTRGHLVAEVTLDGEPLDQAPVTVTAVDDPARRTSRPTDGSGWFGAVDLEPGRYLVQVRRPAGSSGRSAAVVDVEPGQVTTTRLALSRG